MSELAPISIYRIYNVSAAAISLITDQGAKITITPGSTVDLFDFELTESESFKALKNSEAIRLLTSQVLTVSADKRESLTREVTDERRAGSESTSDMVTVDPLAPTEEEATVQEEVSEREEPVQEEGGRRRRRGSAIPDEQP